MRKKKDPNVLNKREKDILKFIVKQVEKEGYPPSVREIGKAVELKSTATVHGYLAKLSEKGYLKKETQKGRTLKVLKGGRADNEIGGKTVYSGKEMVEVPVVRKNYCRRADFSSRKYHRHIPNSTGFCGEQRSLHANGKRRKHD